MKPLLEVLSDPTPDRFSDLPKGTVLRSTLNGSAGAIYGGEDEAFRYLLWRHDLTAANTRQCTFVMLNPSTATETVMDRTVSRCWGFASSWGCNRLEVVNLFAYRATKPKAMIAQGMVGAVGYHNDWFILDSAAHAEIVVCAWGANGTFGDRDKQVLHLLESTGARPMCLRRTKNGHPEHPLYIPGDVKPVPYSTRENVRWDRGIEHNKSFEALVQ